jgi:FliI/YscN family ATPase
MPDTALVDRLSHVIGKLDGALPYRKHGTVMRIVGNVVDASSLDVAVGDLCRIKRNDADPVDAEVVGFHERGIQLMPLGDFSGIVPGAYVWSVGRVLDVGVGPALVGRVINGLGQPIDGKGALEEEQRYPLNQTPPNPLTRTPIAEPLATGVRAIDGLVTLGRGQRVGIFSGSGVGKSVLMGMIAQHTAADVNVIALLGERGREVREFIERDLGPQGLRRSVVVVATSDEPALVRSKGALLATAIAEYFRDAGNDVLLMMDSVTRVGMAWREIGLAIGEPPTTKGYPPSIYPSLAKMLERAGTSDKGSITGLYAVLVEADDFNEPLADAARSILDGHIILSRELAEQRHFPAIDILGSISRLRDTVIDAEHLEAANNFQRLEASYKAHEDLISVGAYKAGSDPATDAAIAVRADTLGYLRQRPGEQVTLEETRGRLEQIVHKVGGHVFEVAS